VSVLVSTAVRSFENYSGYLKMRVLDVF